MKLFSFLQDFHIKSGESVTEFLQKKAPNLLYIVGETVTDFLHTQKIGKLCIGFPGKIRQNFVGFTHSQVNLSQDSHIKKDKFLHILSHIFGKLMHKT